MKSSTINPGLVSILLFLCQIAAGQSFRIDNKDKGNRPIQQNQGYTVPVKMEVTKDAILSESFENAFPPADWTIIDADGDSQNWRLPPAASWAVHSGTKCAASASWTSSTGALNPNNYLVTPALYIPLVDNYRLQYWVCAQDAAHPLEHYKLVLSETGNNLADFTVTLFEETMTAKTPGQWYQRTVNLIDYTGKTIYLAWVHYNCTNMFYLNLDDVTVDITPSAPVATMNFYAADFGTINVNSTLIYNQFQLTNTGIGTLVVSQYSLSNPDFKTSFNASQVSLSGNEVYSFNVTYSPTSVGVDNAILTLFTNGGNLWIHLTGSAYQLPQGMVEAGNGTLTGARLPLEPYNSYSYTQSLFFKDEINKSNQQVSKIFYHYNGSHAWSDSIDVYMGHSTATSISNWVPVSQLTRVFKGLLNVPGYDGWVQLDLDSPFVYNGLDNLVIAMDENTSGYHSPTDEFFCHTYDGNTPVSVFFCSDAINPDPANPPDIGKPSGISINRPNIRLQFENIPTGPVIKIDPQQLDFGYMEAGTMKNLNFTVKNSGDGLLNISSVSGLQLPFSMDFNPVNLLPGEQILLSLNFAPATSGNFSVTLHFSSNASAGISQIVCNGYAYPQGGLYESFEGSSFPPPGWGSSGEWEQGSITGFAFQGIRYAFLGNSQNGKLITPRLNIADGDSLYFYTRNSSSYGSLTVKFSMDMTNWTVIQQVSLSNSWQGFAIALNQATGLNYIGFFGTANVYLDQVSGPQLYDPHLPPDASTLPFPANDSANISINTLLQWMDVQYAKGYKLSMGTNNPPNNILDTFDMGYSTSFVIHDLDYNTLYYWKIVPYNNYGSAQNVPIWSFTTLLDPIIGVFPYFQGFEDNLGLVPPVGWTGNLWNKGTSAYSGNYCAKVNQVHIEPAMLTSPYFNLPANQRISFWWKDNDVNKFSDRNTKTTGHDTTFFELSADHGETWMILSRLSAAIPGGYIRERINISEFAGDSLLVRWRDVSDGSLSGYGSGLDDIRIEPLPLTPLIELNDTVWDAGILGMGSQTQSGNRFTITNGGIGELLVQSITNLNGTGFSTNIDLTSITLSENESYSFGFIFAPVDTLPHLIPFQIVTTGGTVVISLKGKGVSVPPFTFESFEGQVFPPLGWTLLDNDGDGLCWNQLQSISHSGNRCAESASYDNDFGILQVDNFLITPKFTVTNNQDEFIWWVAARYPDYPADYYEVLISTTDNNPLSFNISLFDEILSSDTWMKHKIKLTSFEGQEVYIAFRHHSIPNPVYAYEMMIDDVELTAHTNNIPVFESAPLTNIEINTLYQYNIIASDEDSDPITLKAINLPAWLHLIDNGNGTGVLAGTPGIDSTYFITLMAYDYADTAWQEFNLDVTVGITGFKKDELILYPNPSQGALTIKSYTPVQKIQVFNSFGQMVLSNESRAVRVIEIPFKLPDGIYWIRVLLADGKVSINKMVVKQ